jgi:hypothetical protein
MSGLDGLDENPDALCEAKRAVLIKYEVRFIPTKLVITAEQLQGSVGMPERRREPGLPLRSEEGGANQIRSAIHPREAGMTAEQLQGFVGMPRCALCLRTQRRRRKRRRCVGHSPTRRSFPIKK